MVFHNSSFKAVIPCCVTEEKNWTGIFGRSFLISSMSSWSNKSDLEIPNIRGLSSNSINEGFLDCYMEQVPSLTGRWLLVRLDTPVNTAAWTTHNAAFCSVLWWRSSIQAIRKDNFASSQNWNSSRTSQ